MEGFEAGKMDFFNFGQPSDFTRNGKISYGNVSNDFDLEQTVSECVTGIVIIVIHWKMICVADGR